MNLHKKFRAKTGAKQIYFYTEESVVASVAYVKWLEKYATKYFDLKRKRK